MIAINYLTNYLDYLSFKQLFGLLVISLFLHIFNDYFLQGVLAQLKCKDFWEKRGQKYSQDYVVALICHAFSWSFCICLPYLVLTKFNSLLVYLLLLINSIFHVLVDNEKANRKTINLKEDQCLHFIQVFITWSIAICI